MKYKFIVGFLITVLLIVGYDLPAQDKNEVYLTTGFKIGEVSPYSANIWTRVCGSETPNPVVHKRGIPPQRKPVDFNENMGVDKMDGAVIGTEGEVRIILRNRKDSIFSKWETATDERDYTVLFKFDKLIPYTEYEVVIEARKSEISPITRLTGSFKTAPPENIEVPVLFTASSDQMFWDYDDSIRGFKIYDQMRVLHPDFFVHQGDYVYYDDPGPIAVDAEKARYKWNRIDAWPALVDFYSKVPCYMEKDDHDMLKNDFYPDISPLGELTLKKALKVWYEQVPLSGKPYRTFRWGKELQIWLVENREFRSNNPEPDGPEKTIWGKEQKEWFVNTVEASDATFKILFSSTPIVGPDRSAGKNDNYSNNAFKTEGDWLRNFLSKQHNMFIVNGDRHWQYVSVFNNSDLWEFGHGPASESHVQGWEPNDLRAEHKFLRVHAGFISGKVEKIKTKSQITFTLYDVKGNIVYQKVFQN